MNHQGVEKIGRLGIYLEIIDGLKQIGDQP